MKKIISFIVVILLTVSMQSCEDLFEQCNWYVYDADGILTGYTDKDTCQDWAATWSDVTCSCR